MPLRFARHENLLNLCPHISLIEHLVALIEDESLQIVKLEIFLLNESQHATRRADDNVRRLEAFENFLVLADRNATEERFTAHIRKIFREAIKFVLDLDGKLACIAENQCTHRFRLLVELMQE